VSQTQEWWQITQCDHIWHTVVVVRNVVNYLLSTLDLLHNHTQTHRYTASSQQAASDVAHTRPPSDDTCCGTPTRLCWSMPASISAGMEPGRCSSIGKLPGDTAATADCIPPAAASHTHTHTIQSSLPYY